MSDSIQPLTGNDRDVRIRRQFVTTDWSLVVGARRDQVAAESSLASLCELYWFPLYAFARQQGYSTHDAEDVIQAFFAWLVADDLIRRADRERGRFRTFLLVALRQFCAREYRRATALKRRPAGEVLSLDAAAAEDCLATALANHWTPDRLFDHSWALTLLNVTMSRLRDEYARSDRLARFEALSPFLTDENRSERDTVRSQLGMTDPAFSMALGRLRKRYGQLLQEEIARTVHDTDEVEDELRQILHALSTT